jgi:hypothetical protein
MKELVWRSVIYKSLITFLRYIAIMPVKEDNEEFANGGFHPGKKKMKGKLCILK